MKRIYYMNQKQGLIQKIISAIFAVLILVIFLFFGVFILAIFLVIGLIVGIAAWWKYRQFKKSVSGQAFMAQMDNIKKMQTNSSYSFDKNSAEEKDIIIDGESVEVKDESK